MNTAQANVIPFQAPVKEPPAEISLNDVIFSFHAGQPYFIYTYIDRDKLAELSKTDPNVRTEWGCEICGHQPVNRSMIMTSPTTARCESCHDSITRLFPPA